MWDGPGGPCSAPSVVSWTLRAVGSQQDFMEGRDMLSGMCFIEILPVAVWGRARQEEGMDPEVAVGIAGMEKRSQTPQKSLEKSARGFE